MKSQWTNEVRQAITEILGYLNFSSGARDPRFFAAMDRLYAFLADEAEKSLLAPFIPKPVEFSVQPPVYSPGSVVSGGQASESSASGNVNAFQHTTTTHPVRHASAEPRKDTNPGDDDSDANTPDTNTLTDNHPDDNPEKRGGGRSSPDTDHREIPLVLLSLLHDELRDLADASETFRQAEQAETVIRIVRDHLLDAYRKYHGDLLFHQKTTLIFNSFFLARAFEVVLSRETAALSSNLTPEEIGEIVEKSIYALDDLLGYRPVPVLEGEEKHQPNAHEWVAPVPLYLDEAGAACGKYKSIIEAALRLLRGTPAEVLREAWFDPDKLQELVLDPRAYDFDHPVNRRPNYHFGTWDPHFIDKQGYYRRFVVHQVTIDSILQRIETAYIGESDVSAVPVEELIYEAGAVLAGTMLMGSGISGDTPHSYDSNTSLTNLMPVIAGYRDKFYEHLIRTVPESMRARLQAEEARLHQPFGGARQDLNKRLAKRRADQLQRLHLARTFARMGYFEAAEHQTDIISVASARILCKIDCLITQAHFLIDHEKLGESADLLPLVEDLLHRGIHCGALVDPWTILGFGAQYSLFPAVDNTIHDHRVDDLINLLDDIFDLYSRLQKEAAANGNGDLQAELSDRMSDLAGWWDQFGSTEVSSVEGFSGQTAWESAAKVATALAAWNKASAAAGDIAFWNRHVERFKSPKAYVLLGEALLDQRDPVASMALMMHWLSESETIPLTEGDYSFHSIALRWMEQLWRDRDKEKESVRNKRKFSPIEPAKRWQLTQKFFDYMEANADKYWSVPTLELDPSQFDAPEDATDENGSSRGPARRRGPKNVPSPDKTNSGRDDDFPDYEEDDFSPAAGEEGDEERDGEMDAERSGAIDPTFSAAYENVVYRDTADDGVDDDMMEGKSPAFQNEDDFELAKETERVSERLAFLVTVVKLWKFAAGKSPVLKGTPEEVAEASQRLEGWLTQASVYWRGLLELLDQTSRYRIPVPRGTQESLLEYDRHRGTKEILLDRIGWTAVEVADAILLIQSILDDPKPRAEWASWQGCVLEVCGAIFRSDVKKIKKLWPGMQQTLSKETLLYIPTSRGGNAKDIVACRCLQQVILRLLEYMPRLGLLYETFGLLDTIQQMEQVFPPRPGAITEFDRLVETATRAISTSISEASKTWKIRNDDKNFQDSDEALVDYMERIIELLLSSWLSHSRQIRISPVESITDKSVWSEVKAFIQKYGEDIFTQQFMGFGNLRAVLHQGVENYLKSLVRIKEEESDDELETADLLIGDLVDGRYQWEDAVYNLELIFESIAENYSEYVDYNSTTTHSDHGDRLYMLLDMLRVLTGYERISWNLKPVYWVHDAMIRSGSTTAAALWERAVAKRSVNAAEEHLRSYARLSEKYGMWLPSVHERLQERFVRPLQIDRMCGLVPTAVREAREEGAKTAFVELDQQIELFAREPMGVGFEMPEWLSALQEEVMSTRIDTPEGEPSDDAFNPTPRFEPIRLSRSDLDKLIAQLNRKSRL